MWAGYKHTEPPYGIKPQREEHEVFRKIDMPP